MRKLPRFNLRLFDLSIEDNRQKDAMELYDDAIEFTDSYTDETQDQLRKDCEHRPDYYLLALIAESLNRIALELEELNRKRR